MKTSPVLTCDCEPGRPVSPDTQTFSPHLCLQPTLWNVTNHLLNYSMQAAAWLTKPAALRPGVGAHCLQWVWLPSILLVPWYSLHPPLEILLCVVEALEELATLNFSCFTYYVPSE